jgi:hypothetical protein
MTPTNDDIDAGRPKGPPPAEPAGTTPSSWRLTFEYDESGVRLVAQQRVAMLAPPDDSDLTYAARSGYWVELRDADGHGLYRQILVDPMRSHFEVPPPAPGELPSRVPVPPGTVGVFQAVVPDLPETHDVVLKALAAPGSADTLRERLGQEAGIVLTERLGETPPYGAS